MRTHGQLSTYKVGCRCSECREANNAQRAYDRRTMRARIAADPSLAPHGRLSTYTNWGCRCGECRVVNSARSKAYKAQRRRGERP